MEKRFLIAAIFLNLIFVCNAFAEINLEVKSYFQNKYKNVSFKIDSSFIVDNKYYLPLLLPKDGTSNNKKFQLEFAIPDDSDRNYPKLFWFSNGSIFVKILFSIPILLT